jgi:sec-independent protein translocase protein TatC
VIFRNKSVPQDEDMGFFDHVEVLRWHIIRSFAAILIIAIAAFWRSDWVFDYFLFGPTRSSFPTYSILCKAGSWFGFDAKVCHEDLAFKLVNFELSGQFMVQLQTSLVLGFVIAFPYIIWEIWRFIIPALSMNERRKTSLVILFSSVFFFLGAAFGYFVIIPFSINFFSSYVVSETITNTFSLSNYNEFFTMILLGCGLFFELPMVVYFLGKLGILYPETMRTYRKHAVVAILLVAAIITPSPDAFTQLVVAIPVFFLYELSIWVCAAVNPDQKQKTNG